MRVCTRLALGAPGAAVGVRTCSLAKGAASPVRVAPASPRWPAASIGASPDGSEHSPAIAQIGG